MSVQQNVEVARRFNLDVINNRNLDALEQVLHRQYKWRGGTTGPWSTAGDINEVRRQLESYPQIHSDFRVVIEDVFGDEDKVALRMTHWEGGKPTANVMAIYRFSEGKIIDDWASITPIP